MSSLHLKSNWIFLIFLKRLSGNEEQEALQYLDLLERAIKDFGTDKVSFMTPEYVVGQLNGIVASNIDIHFGLMAGLT